LLESQPVLSGIKSHDLSPKVQITLGVLPLFSPSGVKEALGLRSFLLLREFEKPKRS
jgi:hypothetical protein